MPEPKDTSVQKNIKKVQQAPRKRRSEAEKRGKFASSLCTRSKNHKGWNALVNVWLKSLRKTEPPDDLRGTPEFAAFFSSLDKDSELQYRLKEALDAIKKDMLVGDKIERKKFPKIYVRKYGIHNLFRMETGKGTRLSYTIVSENKMKVVVVLEFFSNHKEYEKRFGYSWLDFQFYACL